MSTRQLLIDRVRLVLLLSLICGSVFIGLELWFLPRALPAPFYVKLLGITVISVTYMALGRPRAVRHAWGISIAVVAAAYVLTALSGIVSPSREYETTAVLFAGGALTTAILLPWGIGPQALSVAIGLGSLLIAIARRDGNVGALADDTGAAVLLVFTLSIATAYEVNRQRLALRHELRERRRAERAVRRLNRQLEWRVRQRTAELEAANHRLAAEIFEHRKTAAALQDSEEARRRHQDELAHVLRVHTVGEMAAALAHEIHQPLGAITNYAQGGVQRLRARAIEPAALLWAFEQIAHEGLRAAQILRGVRNLVKREREPAASIEVNALAAEAIRVVEPQARLHGVTTRLATTAPLPLVQGNATQLEQVILNLLLNAVEAVSDAACVRRDVLVTTTVHGDTVELAVQDSGSGVSPSIADKLFAPFVTTKPRGLGLGLAISRSIIDSHGGHLWTTANPDGGATFHFALPIAAVDDALRDVGT